MLTLVMRVQDDASAQLTRIQKVTKMFGGTVHRATGQLQRFTHRFMQVARALVSFLIMRTVTVQFVKFFKELLRGNEILERATMSISRLVGSLGVAQRKIDYIRATAMKAPFDFESILKASVLLTAYGKDIQKFLPRLLDWAAGMNKTSGELEGYAAAMGKILAQSPHVNRLLQARGIDLATWRQALAEVNQELPKAARFEQALMIVTQRFEGQAATLAKTLYGLKTNIHDVWVEMQREVGLSMFIQVKAALTGLYGEMRNVVDNQREVLWDIGDAIGSWVGRLIMFIKELPRLATPLKVIMEIVRVIAIVLLGRSLIASLMTAVQWVQTLIVSFTAASLAAGGIAAAVGLIAIGLVKAKMKALALKLEFERWEAFIEMMKEFSEREEKIFERQELHFATKQIEALGEAIHTLRQDLPVGNPGAAAQVVDSLKSVLGLAVSAADFFGDEESTLLLLHLMDEMEKNEKYWSRFGLMAPGAREGLADFRSVLADLLEDLHITASGTVALAKAIADAAEASDLLERKETDALAAINVGLEMWQLNMGGVAGYEHATLGFVQQLIDENRQYILSIKGRLELMRTEQGIAEDLLKTEKEGAKAAHERFAGMTAMLDQQRAVAEAKHGLGGAPEDLMAVYQQQLDAVKQMMMVPGFAPEDMDALLLRMYELLAVIQDLDNEMKDMNDASAFEQYSAVVEQKIQMWQSALRPVSNALANMVLDVKNIGKYAAQAFKEMISWAIRLAFQYLILAILRMIWDPTASMKGGKVVGTTDAGGAMWSGPKQGVKAADGFRGMVNQPTMFLAGEEGPEHVNITPLGGGKRGGGGGGINIYGDVYGYDDFVDKVQSAQGDIALATGGEG